MCYQEVGWLSDSVLVVIRMIPPVVASTPIFLMSKVLGVLDTHVLMISIYILVNMALVVWVMRSFFDEIPRDIDEAAYIDGYSKWETFWKVLFPLVLPGFIAVAILCIIFTWNEFAFALILAARFSKTLPPQVLTFMQEHRVAWGNISAAAVVIGIPVILGERVNIRSG